jgi:hypothetical protein
LVTGSKVEVICAHFSPAYISFLKTGTTDGMPNLIMKAYRSLKLSNHTERAMVVGTIEVLMDTMDAVWGKDANLA